MPTMVKGFSGAAWPGPITIGDVPSTFTSGSVTALAAYMKAADPYLTTFNSRTLFTKTKKMNMAQIHNASSHASHCGKPVGQHTQGSCELRLPTQRWHGR